jgi:hypothetical protein
MLAEQRALTFGMLFEDGEVKVIGDEPANTDYVRACQRKLLSQGGGWPRGVVARHRLYRRRRVPCGEANRKAECRKSARSV